MRVPGTSLGYTMVPNPEMVKPEVKILSPQDNEMWNPPPVPLKYLSTTQIFQPRIDGPYSKM